VRLRTSAASWITGAIAAIGIVVLATLLDGTPRVVVGHHEATSAPAATAGDRVVSSATVELHPRDSAPSRRDDPSAPETATAGRRIVDDLVDALEAIDASTPDTFHEPAAVALEEFAHRAAAAIATDEERRREFVPQLIDALGRVPRSPRVRGALLAAVGGLGDVDFLLEAMPVAGEERRSALIGLGWDPLHAVAPNATTLRPDEFLSGRRKLYREMKLDVLPLPMRRLASERGREWLPNAILRPCVDEEDALSAELAELALGTAVDADATILAFFTARLTDTNESLRYLREAALYVLARASSPAARSACRDGIVDAGNGPLDAILHAAATRWLTSKSLDSETIRAIARPLSNPEPPRDALDATPRLLALASLIERMSSSNASPEELADIESVLSTSAGREHEPRLHLAMVASLAESPGSDARLFTLEGVLRGDPDAACRRWAANGLGRTTGDLAEPARAMLRRALSGETDPDVRAEIAKALDSPR
jgi:hypothetical protein